MRTRNSLRTFLIATTIVMAIGSSFSISAQDRPPLPPETYDEPLPQLGPEDFTPAIIPPSKSRMVTTKVRAVLITANGCGKCKIVRRKLEGNLSIAGLDVVELDYTKKDEARFYGRAHSMGIEEALRAKIGTKIKPGDFFLINVNSKRVISEIKHNDSAEDIMQRLKNAVASS